jgi:hypothetical protein
MTNVRTILSATLLASAAIGTQIVLTDQYLLAAAPSHYYGLAAFVAIDVILALALWKRVRFGSVVSIALATVQAIAMLGDVLTYSTPDVPQQAFRSYLLKNPAFMALLVVQPIILGLAFAATNVRSDYSTVRRWFQTNLLH